MTSIFLDEDGTVRLRGTATGVSPAGAAGGVLDGTYPNPGLAAGVAGAGLAETADVLSVNVDGATLEINADALRVKALGITDSQVATANKDGTAGTPSMRTLGTGATQALAGNAAAGGVLDGTYPNPGLAAGVAGAGLAETADVLSVNVDGATLEISADALRVKDLGITAGKVALLTLTDAQVATANKDGTAGTPSMRTLGTGGAQAVAGNDSRLSDARAPSGNAGGKLKGTYPNPGIEENILGGAEWTVVRKASDEPIASSTVLQNDDELLFTAAAATFYEVELILVYASPAGAGTPDMKCALGEDATTRGVFQTTQFTPVDAASQTNIEANQTAVFTPGTAAAKRMAFVAGVYAGNGGIFRLLWAQNTSNINPTILYAGSILRYRAFA